MPMPERHAPATALPADSGGLDDADWALVREILRSEPAVERALLVGSRAMGTHSQHSDVDLIVEGSQVDLPVILRLQGRFEESNLAVPVGVSRLHKHTHPPFREHVQRWGRDIPLEPPMEKHGEAPDSVGSDEPRDASLDSL